MHKKIKKCDFPLHNLSGYFSFVVKVVIETCLITIRIGRKIFFLFDLYKVSRVVIQEKAFFADILIGDAGFRFKPTKLPVIFSEGALNTFFESFQHTSFIMKVFIEI